MAMGAHGGGLPAGGADMTAIYPPPGVCGQPVVSGRARIPIGPCMLAPHVCAQRGGRHHYPAPLTGCLWCGRLVEADQRTCPHCRHRAHVIAARCDCGRCRRRRDADRAEAALLRATAEAVP